MEKKKEFNEKEEIKNIYGEDMMHFCRSKFPSILAEEGKLLKILKRKFAPNKYLFNDLEKNHYKREFVVFINEEIKDNTKNLPDTGKFATELMSEAGYNLTRCFTEADIQSFKKYYAPGEELCTFKGGRGETDHVFFAVKKNVDSIRRKDFKNPERQDEYGTSVISIQFFKYDNILSIKNRYNHTVKDCDSTFDNNLENIIPGLTKSFNKTYDLNIKYSNNKIEMPYYVRDYRGIYHKYNYKINDIYYCIDNIIIDHGDIIEEYANNNSRYIVCDYFIIDIKEKTIKPYDKKIKDTFFKQFKDIKKIDVRWEKGKKIKDVNIETSDGEILLKINKKNRLIYYKNDNIESIDNRFLEEGKYLEYMDILGVKEIKTLSLRSNENLKELYIEGCTKIGDNVLPNNNSLKYIYMPKVLQIGDNFLLNVKNMKKIAGNNLVKVGEKFMPDAKFLEETYFPNLEYVGPDYLLGNLYLKEINYPSLEIANCNFLNENKIMDSSYLPKLKYLGSNSFEHNEYLEMLYVPELIKMEDNVLKKNLILKVLFAPRLEYVGSDCLRDNIYLDTLVARYINHIGRNFLFYNKYLENFELSHLKKRETGLLFHNTKINIIEKTKRLIKH